MSGLTRRARATALVAAPVFALALVIGIAGGAAALGFDDQPTPGAGYGLKVVVPGTATDSGSGSSGSSGPGSSSRGYGHGSGSGVGASESASPSSSPTPTPSAKPGTSILTVSGLSSTPHLSLNPTAGELVVNVTVENGSTSTIDCTAAFVLDSPTGSRISSAPIIDVKRLKPGETRTLQVNLDAVGQWTLLHPKVTVTPPKSVDGVALSPIVRDQWVLVAPWLVLVLVVLGAAAIAIVLVARAGFALPVRWRAA